MQLVGHYPIGISHRVQSTEMHSTNIYGFTLVHSHLPLRNERSITGQRTRDLFLDRKCYIIYIPKIQQMVWGVPVYES
jgi:hypothetical protein